MTAASYLAYRFERGGALPAGVQEGSIVASLARAVFAAGPELARFTFRCNSGGGESEIVTPGYVLPDDLAARIVETSPVGPFLRFSARIADEAAA